MTSDIQNLWKTYLYTLQIQAPKPKTIFCENKISDKPSFYGNEYHGKLSRENANKLLDQNGEGSFLVRESERYPGTYTLCLKYGRVNRHYKLYYDGNHHYVRPDKRVRSLRHLVADGLITMHVEARAGPYLKRELKLRRQKRVAADKHEDTLIDLYLESSCEAFPRSLVEGSTALEPSTLLPYPSTRVIHYQNVKDIIPSNHDNSSGLEKSSSSTSTKTSSRRDSSNKNSPPLTGCNGEEINNKPSGVSKDYTSSMIPPSKRSSKVSQVEFITTYPPPPSTEIAVKTDDGKSDDVSSASANTMMAAVVTGDCSSSSAINNNNNALYANYEIVIKYQQGEHQLTKTCDDDIQLNRNSHQQTILNGTAREKIISNDKSNKKADDDDKQQSNCNSYRQTILNERAGKTIISNDKSRRKADDTDDDTQFRIRQRQTIFNETEEEIINDKSNRKADDNDDDKQQMYRNSHRQTIFNETEADEIDKIRRKADDNDSIGEGVVMRKKEKPVVIYENGSSEEIFLKRFYPVSTTVMTNTNISLYDNKSNEHSTSGWGDEYKLCENPVYAYPSAVLSPASYNNDTKTTKPMMSSCIRSISNPSSEHDKIHIDFMDTSEALLRRQPATIKEHHQQLVNFKKSSAPPIPSSVIITNDVLSVNNNDDQRTRLVSSTVYCGGRSNPKTNSTVLTLSDLALPHRQHHSRNAVHPISLTEEDMTTAQVLLTPYNTCRLPNNHASGKPFFSSFSHNRKDNNTNYYKPEIPNDSSASSSSLSPNPNFLKKSTMTAAASAAAKNHHVRNSINFFERSSVVTSSFKYSQQRPSLKLSSAFLPSKQPLESNAGVASYSLPPQNGLTSYSFAPPPPPSTTTTPFNLNSSCSNITLTMVHSTSSLNYVNCYSSAKLGIADDNNNNHNFSITSLHDDSSLLNGGTVSDSVITNSFCGGDYDDTRCTLNTSIYDNDEEAEGENKIGEVVVIKKCKEILRDRKLGETSDPESYGKKRSLDLQNSLSGDCDGFTTDEIPSANEISRSKSSSTSSSLSQLSDDGNYESSHLADQRKHSFKTRTFKSLKWCDICGDFMWGLISQGVKCNECGICAHTRCSRIISNTSATNLPPDPRGFCNRNTCKYLKNRVFGVDITAHLAALRRRAKRNDYYHIGHDSTNQLKPSSQKDMLLLGESQSQNQQNSIKLTTSSPKFSTKIPIVLQVCCKLIEKYGIDSEGIYRIPGSSEDVEKFRQLFDNGCEDGYLELGKSFDIFNDKDEFMAKGKGNFKYKDINLVASVLKLYLRLLPIPLITFECYDTFLNALKHENISEIVDALQIAVRGLPNAHYNSLKYIMLHLKKISDHESKNLMGPSNLAMIFAPNIIKNGDPSSFCMLNDSAGLPVGGCGANSVPPPNFFPPSFQTNSQFDSRQEQQTNKLSKPNKHHSRVQQTNSNNNNNNTAPPLLNNGFQQLQPQEESSALTTKAGGGATMQDYFSTLKLECRVIEFLIIHVDQIFNLSSIPS